MERAGRFRLTAPFQAMPKPAASHSQTGKRVRTIAKSVIINLLPVYESDVRPAGRSSTAREQNSAIAAVEQEAADARIAAEPCSAGGGITRGALMASEPEDAGAGGPPGLIVRGIGDGVELS